MYTQTVDTPLTIKGTVAVKFSALTENLGEDGTPIGERDNLMVSAMLVDIAPRARPSPPSTHRAAMFPRSPWPKAAPGWAAASATTTSRS